MPPSACWVVLGFQVLQHSPRVSSIETWVLVVRKYIRTIARYLTIRYSPEKQSKIIVHIYHRCWPEVYSLKPPLQPLWLHVPVIVESESGITQQWQEGPSQDTTKRHGAPALYSNVHCWVYQGSGLARRGQPTQKIQEDWPSYHPKHAVPMRLACVQQDHPPFSRGSSSNNADSHV